MIIATNISIGFARTLAMIEILSPIYMYDLYCIDKWSGRKFPFFVLLGILVNNIGLSFAMIEFMGDSGLRNTIQADSDNIFKGAMSIVTSLALIIPLCAFLLRRHHLIGCKRKKLVLIMISLFLFSSLYLIFRSFFITPLVVALIGCVFAMVYGRKRWFIKSIVMVIFSVFLFLSFFSSIVSFVDNIGYGTSNQVTPKLYELKYTLIGESHNADDLSSRSDLATSSLKTFSNSPIWGVSNKAKNFEETSKIGVGNHSEWLDDLALYGMFSILLFLFLILAAIQQIKKHGYSLSLLVFIFLGFNNPILSFMVVCTVYLLIPVFLDILKFNYNENSNSHCCIQ